MNVSMCKSQFRSSDNLRLEDLCRLSEGRGDLESSETEGEIDLTLSYFKSALV